VPGHVHSPEKRGRWVVIREAGLSVVATAAVNAVMGPAKRIRGIGGLITAHAATAAAGVDPDGEPSLGWLVVQKNGVTLRTSKGALTARVGDPGKRRAAVGRARYARDVDRASVAASGVVVSDADLHGVIRVSRAECLRLRNVGRSLGARDQVNIPGAIQRQDYAFDHLADAFEEPAHRPLTPLRC